MRQWINLFESTKPNLLEAWFKSVPVNDQDATKPTDVFINPSKDEFFKLWVSLEREHGVKLDLPFRAFIAGNDLYIWDAYKACHSDMDYHLPQHVGGYLYLARDHVEMNDLNWQYNDEDDSGKTYRFVVRHAFEAVQNQPCLKRIYGTPVPVIGNDDEDAGKIGFVGGQMPITPEWIEKNVV